MAGQNNDHKTPSLWKTVLMTSASVYAFQSIQPDNDAMEVLRWFCGILALSGMWQLFVDCPDVLYNYLLQRQSQAPSGNFGNAQWMSVRRAKQLKLHKPDGFFLGCCPKTGEGRWIEVRGHILVLGSTGCGKTSSLVMTNLFHDPHSCFVLDVKRTIKDVTAHARQKYLGHEIYVLDADAEHDENSPYKHAYIDLLLPIKEAYRKQNYNNVFKYARKLAACLCPIPENAGGNTYFYDGPQDLLTFIFIVLSMREDDAFMPDALALAQDDTALLAEVQTARCLDELGGDFAGIAKSLLRVQESKRSEHWQSFCNRVVQVLSPYSRNSHLGKVTSKSTFRPCEMKERKITLYVHIDIQDKDIYDDFLELLGKYFQTDWVDYEKKQPHGTPVTPVHLYLDEIANIRIRQFINSAMEVREFGIYLFLFIQSHAGFEKTYSEKDMEVIADQCEVQYYLGVVAEKMASLVSRTLGNFTASTMNYQLGHDSHDRVTMSTGETARALKDANEILESKRGIVFIRGEKSIEVDPVAYSQRMPDRKRQGVNRFWGKKYKERIRLWIRYPAWWSWRRGFGLLKAKPYVAKYRRPRIRRNNENLPFTLLRLFKLSRLPLVIVVLWLGYQHYGVPYMLWQYNYSACEYVTFNDTKRTAGSDCALFRFFP